MVINSFVIEGAVGADLYEKITEAFELCVEFDKYYEIGRVNGKVYTIKKSKNEYCEGSVIYGFSVWDNVVPGNGPDIAYSETNPDCVELKDGNLHISGGVYCGGVLRYYISDVKLHKLTNIYILYILKILLEKYNDSNIFNGIEILKVGHHGSKTSTSKEYIEKVLPKYAVISAKEKYYGHPHKDTLEVLKENNVQIYITEKVGYIKFNLNKL